MSQLRAVGLHDKGIHDKGSGSRGTSGITVEKQAQGEQPKKRISRKREKVISAELRKIIMASSIKYGGAKALMLDDGEGKE